MNGEDLVRDLVQSAEAIGALAGDEDHFRGALDAFRAQDRESFQWLLSEFKVTSASPSAPGTIVSGVGPRGGAGTQHENTSTWQSCSYVVQLGMRPSLTTGLIDNLGRTSQKTFCISGRAMRPVR
jgi:hypothetical protein